MQNDTSRYECTAWWTQPDGLSLMGSAQLLRLGGYIPVP